MTDATAQYMSGQMRAHHPDLLAAFQRESDSAAAAAPDAALDIAYGPHPREKFDFFAGPGGRRGTLAFFHAGYWQSRDKAQFRFLAPALVARGFDVAMVNYPLCPEVDLAALVESTQRAVPAVLSHARDSQLIAAGHSAGAHIAVELALTDWRGRGMAASPISAVVALSGVFDLEPLRSTALNDKLRLDAASARANSPILRVVSGMPPALFVVGGGETDAFRAQSAAMHAAWTAAGNSGAAMEIADADHFTLLQELQGDSELMAAVGALTEPYAAA